MSLITKIRKAKAFTLAEILIVLTVIGVIATITIPQLTGGVDEAQYKASIKKVYSTLANIAAMEKAEKNLPTAADDDAILNFFIALNKNLDVEGYVCRNTGISALDGIVIPTSDVKVGITWRNQHFGDDNESFNCGSSAGSSPWIITADGMAFTLGKDPSYTCKTKSFANSRTSYVDFRSAACVGIVVDVNGLNKMPNKVEPQGNGTIGSTSKLKKLIGDRFQFYLASDGVAKGSPLCTMMGRFLAGEK